jgi:hypothetical protein
MNLKNGGNKMKNIGIKIISAMLVAMVASDVWAAQIYINQNFEGVALNTLPTGWATRTKTTATMTGVKADPILTLINANPSDYYAYGNSHGQVLTIVDSLASGQTNGYEQLEIPFPTAISGEDIRIAFDWVFEKYPAFPGYYQLWGVAVYDSLTGDLPPSAPDQQTWELTSQELTALSASTYVNSYGFTESQGLHRVMGSPFVQNFAPLEVLDQHLTRSNTAEWNTTIYTIHWNAATSEYDRFDVAVWYRGTAQYLTTSATKSPGLGHQLAKMRIWSADPNGSHVNTNGKFDIDNVWVATASIPRFNGEYGVAYNSADLNQDAHVDVKDLAVFAGEWLACFDPKVSTCTHWWDHLGYGN